MNQDWHHMFPRKSLLRTYSTLKHSLLAIKINYSGETRINLRVLIGTRSVKG